MTGPRRAYLFGRGCGNTPEALTLIVPVQRAPFRLPDLKNHQSTRWIGDKQDLLSLPAGALRPTKPFSQLFSDAEPRSLRVDHLAKRNPQTAKPITYTHQADHLYPSSRLIRARLTTQRHEAVHRLRFLMAGEQVLRAPNPGGTPASASPDKGRVSDHAQAGFVFRAGRVAARVWPGFWRDSPRVPPGPGFCGETIRNAHAVMYCTDGKPFIPPPSRSGE
jgi:hypothetical protein